MCFYVDSKSLFLVSVTHMWDKMLYFLSYSIVVIAECSSMVNIDLSCLCNLKTTMVRLIES